MRHVILVLGLAAICSAVAAADLRTPVVLGACVHAGNDPDTYVLLNVDDLTDGKPVPAGPVYWLASTKEVKGHVGQRVEIRGTYSVDRDYGKTATMKIKPDAKTREQKVILENGAKKAELNEELKTVGTSGTRETETVRPYRQLKVDSVKTIASRCDVP